jgi:LPS sulfotransferase NodH
MHNLEFSVLDSIPNNKSIIILANYRTGSTALCNWLSKKFNLVNLDEAFHPAVRKPVVLNKQFIIKIMPDHMVPLDFVNHLDDAYVIGLKRKSLIYQVSSFYISDKTRIWHYKKDNLCNDYTIDIDPLGIEDQIRYILKMTQLYDNSILKKDLEIYYEDIVQEISNSEYKIYPKPKNYNELLSQISITIEQILND